MKRRDVTLLEMSAATPLNPLADPLVVAAMSGDRDAEREVCRRLLPALRAFALRRLPAVMAEDLAQDALLVLIESMRERRIVDPSQVASFALGVCRNLLREGARSSERRQALLARYAGDDVAVFEPPTLMRRSHLEDCYSQLTERARRVVRATFCEDDTDAEIAAALSISESNVRVIRHRSLAALRTCLERPISWSQS